jgi:hypothetical protein
MLESLKKAVCQANLDLVKEGLVVQTWGNASGLDRARGLMVIKPSGVSYSVLKPAHMVVVALAAARWWRENSSPVPTPKRTWNCIALSAASAASSTRTACTPPRGRKPASPSRPWARRRRITFTAKSLARGA